MDVPITSDINCSLIAHNPARMGPMRDMIIGPRNVALTSKMTLRVRSNPIVTELYENVVSGKGGRVSR